MKIRKQLAVLIAGALAVGTLTGCGSSSTSTSEKSDGKSGGTLTVLTHRTDMDAVFAKYKEEFESKHSGVTVNFESLNDYQNTMNTRMGTEDYGDVLMMPANITKNQYKDFYEPMGTESELKDKYGFLDNANVDGTIYGLSTGANANGFVYNEKVLKDAGITQVPTTPEEFQAALKAIKEKTSAVPLYTNYVADWSLTNWTNAQFVNMSGDVDYPNKVIYDKNAFGKGSPLYTSLKLLNDAVASKYVEEDPMTSDWEKSKQDMADNKIGIMALGSWAIGQIQAKSQTPESIKFMSAPVNNNGKQVIQIASDYMMGVNIHSKNKDLAKEFVRFFVEKYPNDSNMISSIVGAKLPDYLSGSKAELVQQKMGTTQSTVDLDKVQKESLINLNDSKWVKTVIEIGLGNGKQNFDEYMASLNKSWNTGIDSIGK
ncbi:carbohydrate ABC transporter substrate-binding protein [Clostridium chromiireducens]|uniref:Carbohydrate ABC transporter substrate-binding protein n=1 Tax=Clostridium chromiireducens TaxID=225345 RepID=A0A399ITR5_9CLOT|nr:ABC transporter substrate-binding protein [Clostridium chromiireducens]RII36478.1 carbohydrate ABC transporter substrate-binding protein [Clostridium chromiireducens]